MLFLVLGEAAAHLGGFSFLDARNRSAQRTNITVGPNPLPPPASLPVLPGSWTSAKCPRIDANIPEWIVRKLTARGKRLARRVLVLQLKGWPLRSCGQALG